MTSSTQEITPDNGKTALLENGSSTSPIEEKEQEVTSTTAEDFEEKQCIFVGFHTWVEQLVHKTTQALSSGVSYSKSAYRDLPEGFLNKVIATTALIVGFLFFVLVVRLAGRTSDSTSQGWFCRNFQIAFAPIFDALCTEDEKKYLAEVQDEISTLSHEIYYGFFSIFHNIFKGLAVFGTIFHAIWTGITSSISSGANELVENVEENLGFLVHFIGDLGHYLIHITFSTIATFAGYLAGAANSINDYFNPPQKGYFW